ncbi:MAG: ImmA/IrrE family metallo-endopeptidase [Syntrophomonadaceae bacterium]|jgi:Zn-dependent peptidase ImmA (M78 family)|nr:ImmA/IrrE family metallo-endopeptidase [Syntrophomonadaceae bacterium]
MATGSKVEVSRDIYLWAIEESQKDFIEIKNRFEKIETWISGEDYPTFRQVERLANFLGVPLGYMFLDEPPRTSIIESEFRTIGNKIPEISKNLQDTLYIMARKKDWLSEYRREKGWSKLLPHDFGELSRENILPAKKYIDLDEFWYKEHRNKGTAFRYLRQRLEDKGIIVTQSGIVGSDNRRRLDVNEFRGFLLYDDLAPLIFINSRDSEAGKIFTLIHEYIHFLLQEDDIFIDEDSDETNINMITAEFLMPTSHVQELWDNIRPELEQIEELSRLFHVSRLAVAIKLKDIGKISRHVVNTVKQQTEKVLSERGEEVSNGGGNYYRTIRSRLGDSFLRAVIQGAEAGDISYTYAFDLLGGSAKLYDYFKEEFIGYER